MTVHLMEPNPSRPSDADSTPSIRSHGGHLVMDDDPKVLLAAVRAVYRAPGPRDALPELSAKSWRTRMVSAPEEELPLAFSRVRRSKASIPMRWQAQPFVRGRGYVRCPFGGCAGHPSRLALGSPAIAGGGTRPEKEDRSVKRPASSPSSR